MKTVFTVLSLLMIGALSITFIGKSSRQKAANSQVPTEKLMYSGLESNTSSFRTAPQSPEGDKHYKQSKHEEIIHSHDACNDFLKDVLKKKGNRELTIADIPESKLKKHLTALNAKNKKAAQRALNHLAELDIPVHDFDELLVDSTGELIYACKGMSIEAGAGAAAEPVGSEVTVAAASLNHPPVLHSKPGSANIIYLDFDGENVSGTAWNSSTDEVLECKAYDQDGDPSTFNDSEQAHIITAWKKVSEDYAPFDVDVTTERPAVFNSRVAHVMITPSTDKNGVALPHNGYGGIAYVNVFGGGSWAPRYLISWCQPYNGTSVSEVISHEVGHNMGLSHDGINSSTYYRGHGSGETSWGPIMGASYGKNVTQWSKGEYTGATNLQDDLTILDGKLTVKPDDHGVTTASASTLQNSNGIISDQGLIERTSEKDFFKFSVNPGAISINVDSYRSGVLGSNEGNMDVKIELKNASGTTVATHNPSGDTDAVINYNAPARGDYYLVVSPSSISGYTNDPPTGYSVYGTLGSYFISGSFSPYANRAPEIETPATASPAIVKLGSSTSLTVSAFDPDFDSLTYSWSKVSGPGNVQFSKANADSTTAQFSQIGNYSLRVRVSDGLLNTDSFVNVTVTSASVVSESGSFNTDQPNRNTWYSVSLSKNYQNPVIIFSPLTTNGGQPAHIRVKNAGSNSFEWQMEEWDYLDGYHIAEKVDYIVLEAGEYILADGRRMIAGNTVAGDSFSSTNFSAAFGGQPVVVAQLISAQDATPGTVRLNNVTTSSFDLKIQSEEAKGKTHGDEIVSYIAVETGMYEGGGLLEADTTGISINHNWFNIQFNGSYASTPSFFASFQTQKGGDTADLRIRNLTNSSVDAKVHEEQSKDSEINHVNEKLGYILFDLK